MYESPVEIMYGEMRSKIENAVYTAIQDVGIKVNKDQLISALMYDRHQYEAGFKDGMRAALLQVARSLNEKDPEICLLHAMKWKDEGCCMNCTECVKNYTGGGNGETT